MIELTEQQVPALAHVDVTPPPVVNPLRSRAPLPIPSDCIMILQVMILSSLG